MLQEQTTTTLTKTFSEVLANLAFMFTDDEPAEPCPDDRWLETTIAYHGPESGSLRFWCTRSFATSLAANLLGVDPQDETARDQEDDAVKELMNIVCGQLVTAMYGATRVFELTIPETHEIGDLPETPDAEYDSVVTLFVEGHRVRITHVPVENHAD